MIVIIIVAAVVVIIVVESQSVIVPSCVTNNTVEPPNKGHFGDNINSAVVSFVERLSSCRRFKMY